MLFVQERRGKDMNIKTEKMKMIEEWEKCFKVNLKEAVGEETYKLLLNDDVSVENAEAILTVVGILSLGAPPSLRQIEKAIEKSGVTDAIIGCLGVVCFKICIGKKVLPTQYSSYEDAKNMAAQLEKLEKYDEQIEIVAVVKEVKNLK